MNIEMSNNEFKIQQWIQFFEFQFFEIQFFEIQFFEIQFLEIQFFEIQLFEKTMKKQWNNYEKPWKTYEKPWKSWKVQFWQFSVTRFHDTGGKKLRTICPHISVLSQTPPQLP